MRIYRTAGKGIWKAAKVGVKLSQRGADNLSDVWDSRAGRSGILGPGDAPPPPERVGDFLDYRGAAMMSELRILVDEQFPLGTPIRFHRRDKPQPIGASSEVMARHAVVLGPSGSGKTESVMIPWIGAALDAGHTVIATDIKGNLKERIRAFRNQNPARTKVRTITWDTEASPGTSTSWNWIGSLITDAQLDAAIVGLIGRQDRSPRPDLWNIDFEISKGLIRYAQAVNKGPITANDLRNSLNQDEIERDLAGNQRFPGYAELWPYVVLSPSDFTKATSGIRPVLAALSTASIDAATRQPKLDLDNVLNNPGLFIIGARLGGGSTTEKLTALAVGVIQQRLNERLTKHEPYPPCLCRHRRNRTAARSLRSPTSPHNGEICRCQLSLWHPSGRNDQGRK